MRTGKVLLLLFVFSMTWMTGAPTGAQAQQRTLGPMLRIYTDPFLFDTVRCRIRRCVPLTFHNIGDTALVVHNHDVVRRPFSVRIDTPLVLQPGEMRTFELCYNPSQYTSDSQKVFIRADTRLPLSIAMVHDVSASMFTDMPGGKKRYQAAHDASVEFIGNLLDTLGVEDEGAVFTYDDNEHFKIVQTWTKDTAALRAAIPNVVLGTATCTYDAVSRTIDSMSTRVKKRILIMVTDGEDSGVPTCGIASPASVIKKALDHDVRIYAITIGNIDRAPLISIAKATGGKEFNATVSTDLLAIYREIAVDMSKNVQVSIFMKAAAAGPKLEITPPAWTFDSVQVGETACEPVLVRNAGNAWLHADTVRKIFQPPYSLQDLTVDSIAPYQTVAARVCFTPLLPLHYQSPMPYFPSPCQFTSDTLFGAGSSFLLPREPKKKPLLEVRPPVFDTTFCQTTECRELELHNAGDTVVTVRSLDFIPPPFTGSETVPFAVLPGETKSITICYRPPDAPRLDTLRLGFTADMRAPQRIALFFDESASMGKEFMPGLSRLLAASAGATDFADGMEFSARFTDAVTVVGFDTAGVLRWDGRYFTDRDSLRAALLDSAGAQISCPYDAVDHLLTGFDGLHTPPQTVVLFTAGEDGGAACGPLTATELASHALGMGVRIHCVQLGDADSTTLEQLAASTGGRYLRPRSLLDLILALRDLEDEFSRDARFEHTAIARGVTPIIQVDRDTIDCGVYYSSNHRSGKSGYVNISNIGDAPLLLIEGEGLGPGFETGDGSFVISLNNSAPGDSVVVLPAKTYRWSVNFTGREDRAYLDTLILLHNSCTHPALEIPVIGRMIVVPEDPWVYPTAVEGPAPLSFGTVSCNGERCLDFMLRNPGSTPNTVMTTALPTPFRLEALNPLVIPAQDSLAVTACYQPAEAGQHDQWLHLESENMPILSTVLVHASDRSIFDTLTEGPRYLSMRYAALMTYLAQMHRDSLGGNETAVFSFDADGVDTLQDYSHERWRISRAPMDSTEAAPGDLAVALNTGMDYANANARNRKYVIAIVNDANPISAADAEALRDRAARENVTLAIAVVGADGYAALAPTAGTAARFDSCFTLAALESFIYETTRSAVVTVRDSMYLSGSATEAKLEVAPLTLDLGTIRVGGDACVSVTLRNSGNADLTLVDVDNPVEPFPTVFPATLAAGDSAEVELCFASAMLGLQSAEVLFIYDGCSRDTIRVTMTAMGYDSVSVGISAVVRGMPGHVVRIPVQLYGAVPASYGVHGYELSVSYNKTMLYPIVNGEVVSEGTATFGMQPGIPFVERAFSDASAMATTRYRVSGTAPLSSPLPTAVLLAPPFLVLHGDALETPVRITQFRFTDGSPAAGIAVEGRFIADSLCFQEQRLVDGSARYNASLVGGYPNPFNPVATIAYTLQEAAPVRLSIHDALGRRVRVIDEGLREAGLHRAEFDASGLPTGMYFYRLESGGELHTGSLLYLK